jgi:hypothetical protein
METFTEPRKMVANARYADERRAALDALDMAAIDEPIVDIVEAFARLPHCYTLQCCYGHFLPVPGQDDHSLAPIPEGHTGSVRYRIAYVAFCIENCDWGRAFLDTLSRVSAIDPGYVQFGSADWFWEQWVNSYTLQVDPAAHRFKDQADLAGRDGAAHAAGQGPLLRRAPAGARRGAGRGADDPAGLLTETSPGGERSSAGDGGRSEARRE